jgi:hypothetical protein
MKNYTILLLSYSFSSFSGGILGPIYAYFVQKVGGGILETAGSVAAFSIAGGITTFIITRLNRTQKYNMWLLGVGWFLWLLSVMGYACIDNVPKLFIAEILSGLGSALSTPVFDAEFSHESSHNLLIGWGDFEAITSIISGIAALVGGAVAYYFGFQALIYLMILTAIASFIVLLYYINKKIIEEKNNLSSQT